MELRSSKHGSDPLEDAYLYAHPNPQRIDCPDKIVLKGLASKKLPISHPARKHIAQCSPCWREFRHYEAQYKCSKKKRFYGSVAASLILVGGSFGTFYWQTRRAVAVHHTQRAPVMVAFSTEPFWSLTRGPRPNSAPKVPSIPARKIDLSLTLPFGFHSGQYSIVIRNDKAEIISGTGHATIQTAKTVLIIRQLDVSRVPSGKYELLLRGSKLPPLPLMITDNQ